MAISYPLSLPSVMGPSDVVIRAENVTAISRSPFSFAQKVYSHPGQMWSADVTLPPMDRPDAEQWVSFLVSLKGQAGTFLMGDRAPRGAMSGTPLVNGADQTGGTLIIDGADTGVTGWALAGDYIQLGSGATATLHKVLQDVDSDGSGNVTLDIWPNLRSSPADNAAVTVDSPVGRWRLATPTQEWSVNAAQLYGITFSAIEAIG